MSTTVNKKEKIKKEFIIGIDGGATKTEAWLADLKGKVLFKTIKGSSSPRNVGIEKAARVIAEAISELVEKTDKKSKIVSVFVGLPAIQEEFQGKKEKIKKEILKQKNISRITKNEILIGSDQITAFRSGTDEKNGILIIAGTGHVVHGWWKNKEVHVNGWGWLADEGSSFWVGHKALQKVFMELDGRGKKTLITELILKKFSVKSQKKDLLLKIYSDDFVKTIASLSVLVGKADKRNDRIAREILIQAGNELALSVKTAVNKLNIRKEKYPLVLVGGMFKSKILFEQFKKEVRKFSLKINFIRPKKEPVTGALKLAREQIYVKKT